MTTDHLSSVRPSIQRPTVLADVFPFGLSQSVAAVALAVAWIGVLAQIKIPLGFTPVPMTLGTFAVATVGGALGAYRGTLAAGIYLVLGLAGLPVFQGFESGWDYATGTTFGYLVGYLVLALAVGFAADRRADRHFLSFFGALVGGNVVLYMLGGTWLAYRLNSPLLFGADSGFALGVRPFLLVDLIKMAVAALLFPSAWKLVGRPR